MHLIKISRIIRTPRGKVSQNKNITNVIISYYILCLIISNLGNALLGK